MKRTVFVLMFVTMACTVAEAQTTIYFARDTIFAGPGGGAIATVTPPNSDTTAPTAPSGLGVTSTTATSVALSWSISTDSGGSLLAGYKVYRQIASGASLPVGTVNSSTTAFTDQPVPPGTSITYVVRAFDNAQNHSSASNSVNPTTSAASTDATAPGPPQQLTGRVLASSSVELQWLFATDLGGSGIAAYRVKRGGADISGWLSASTRTYGDTSAPQNSSLTYTAEAKDGQGNISSASNSVNVTTPLESIPPTTPTSFSASGLTTTSLRLSWTASSDSGGSGLSGYKVYKAGVLISGSSPVTGTTFDHTGLYPNTTYTAYTVKAIDGAGNLSAAAGPINGTTLPDTIAPTAPSNFQLTSSGEDWMNFGWSTSTDSGGSGLAGYKVYFLGDDTFSSWEYLLSGPDPVTSASYSVDTTGWTWEYYVGFRVYAIDAAGNLSSPTDWLN